jgi:Fe-S cluster assembly protein SufD
VRCTHAAAVAQLDKDQLYYLRAHGLPKPEAQRLIIDGFLQELVARLAEGQIREIAGGALEARLAELLA